MFSTSLSVQIIMTRAPPQTRHATAIKSPARGLMRTFAGNISASLPSSSPQRGSRLQHPAIVATNGKITGRLHDLRSRLHTPQTRLSHTKCGNSIVNEALKDGDVRQLMQSIFTGPCSFSYRLYIENTMDLLWDEPCLLVCDRFPSLLFNC